MARSKRIVVPNCPHHITQRGNNRQDVFFSDTDREIYLNLLKKYTAAHHVDVLGYCLMTNHVHIVATPATADALSRAIDLTHNDYSRWLHIRRSESGHLWQGRFYSCAVESHYLSAVLAYIERNPVRASLVPRCDAWHWSSAKAHLAATPHAAHDWLNLSSWAASWTPALWHTGLESGLSDAHLQARFLEATRTGRPFGDPPFVQSVKKQFTAAA